MILTKNSISMFITNVCTNPISAKDANITHNQIDGILISTNYNHVDDKQIIHAQDRSILVKHFFDLKTKSNNFTLSHKNLEINKIQR